MTKKEKDNLLFDKAIQHHEENLAQLHKNKKNKECLTKGLHIFSSSCSFCKTYSSCISCPISDYTGCIDCRATPWVNIYLWYTSTKPLYKNGVKYFNAEIRFLKSLKKEI